MADKKAKGAAANLKLIEEQALIIAAEQNIELVDMEYIKEGGEWYLRFYIDRDIPVDHDCCQAFSEVISDWLDEADPIKTSYILEVSSPGVERPLKKTADFDRFAGNTVAVKLYAPFEGQREYLGELIGLKNNNICLLVNEKNKQKEIFIPYDAVAKVHLVADF